MDRIAFLAQLAAVLEVSTEKPGNVSPAHDFADTTYGDFLLSSVAVGFIAKESALRGLQAGKGEIPFSKIGVGGLILEGVKEIQRSNIRGNTHFGTLLLFVPLAAAAGYCISRSIPLRKGLRSTAADILKDSSVQDSRNFYEAIKLTGVGGLVEPLEDPEVSFHDLMKISSSVDRIAEELSDGMEITFEFSVPALDNILQRTDAMMDAILQTYLIILSEFPDTLIAKKLGIEKSREVSVKASEALEAGGVFSEAGKTAIEEFNVFLRTDDNILNPGTTADLVAAAVYVWLLYNYSQEAQLP
ncbi:MAG: triphosphoribosyl-dephospho-CoA synthase [Candidatus Altiarchaeota archaeon]|nr:triphosphoribosyl-dephospho-CoA synthase [Candidatus Altiarchaeota archaeon]